MWKVVGPNPHWEAHPKKMWSPLPVPRRDPVKLPFLEVTPSTVLERLRGQSEQETGEEDRSPLALWSTEPIDLSRTTPPDFGYRGVYLGKLRKGSALGRSINAEKSYSILPNKFASGGVGSARASERGGLTSPQISSPGHHKKFHSLQPLDQVDSASVLGHQALSRIPPLRSGRATSSESIFLARDEDEMFNEEEEDEEEEEEEEEDEEGERVVEEAREEQQIYNYNDEEAKKEIENELEQREVEQTTVNDGTTNHEEEENKDKEEFVQNVLNGEHFEEANGCSDEVIEINIGKGAERSSAETRDSGISINSPHPETVNEDTTISSTSSERKKSESESVSDDKEEDDHYYYTTNESKSSALEDDSQGEEISTAQLRRRMRRHNPSIHHGRNSFDPSQEPLQFRGGKFRRDSTNSLPSSLSYRQTPFLTKNKGFYPGGPKSKKSNVKSSAAAGRQQYKNFDYENDFESEDEDGKDTMSRMNYLKKKRDTMRELERKIAERDAEKERVQRIQKYKELELRHSGNSLQITRPDEEPLVHGRINKPSPRPSPRPSPDRQRKPFALNLPKSRSHDRNLSQNSPLPDRPSSLDRLEGSFSKLPFSRAPPQQRRVIRAKGRTPAPLLSDTPSSRRSTPGIGLGRSRVQKSSLSPSSMTTGATINEDDIPTACFKNPKVLNTIHGKKFQPLNKPNEIYIDNMALLKSDEWEDQVEGIETIVRLATFHPKVILPDLKEVNALVMKHAKNLRSQVCRAALQAITQFLLSLKKYMEQDLDKIVSLLLNKTSDTNKFLREDSNCALDAVVEVTTPSKALSALINEGIGHRNPQVKTTVGRLLAYETELIGASRALSQRDIAEKLIPAAAKLAQEGSLETRQMAKLIFQRLATQPQFEQALRKFVPSEDLKQIQRFLGNMYSDTRGGLDTSRNKGVKGASRFGRHAR